MIVFEQSVWLWVWYLFFVLQQKMVENSIPMVCFFFLNHEWIYLFIFDTFPFFWLDWMVADGTISGNQSVATFEQILTNATQIDTGWVIYIYYTILPKRKIIIKLHSSFIVLEHDSFEATVDLAVGYTLDLALTHDPKLDVRFPPPINFVKFLDTFYI